MFLKKAETKMGEKKPIFRCPSARAGADFFKATVRCADNNNNNSCCPHIVRVRLQPSQFCVKIK